jgi:hypothetical protein
MMVGILVALAVCATGLAAHDDYRIVGTITKIKDKQLEVKTKEGKTFSIGINDLTLVKRDKAKVSATELKVSASVVVDARGDSEQDLMAVEVRIVPVIAAAKKK